MLISVCGGYYDLDGKLNECGVVIDREDDAKEEESVMPSLRYCPKCYRITENLAELFYNRVGSKNNIY